jgi:hypothetical protein
MRHVNSARSFLLPWNTRALIALTVTPITGEGIKSFTRTEGLHFGPEGTDLAIAEMVVCSQSFRKIEKTRAGYLTARRVSNIDGDANWQ